MRKRDSSSEVHSYLVLCKYFEYISAFLQHFSIIIHMLVLKIIQNVSKRYFYVLVVSIFDKTPREIKSSLNMMS